MPLIQSNTPCKIYVGVSSISLIVFQFLLFFTLLTPVYAAGNSQDYSDQFVCSWFDLKDPPIKFINEANNRNIDCKRIFSSSSEKVQYYCKYGYKRVGTSCVKKTALIIPANAYKSGNTWYCKSGYKKTGNSCTKSVSNKNIPNQNYDGEKIVSNIEYEAANTNKSVNTTSDNKAALFFLLLLVIGLLIPNSRGRIKKCAWCRSKKIKFISGTKGPWEWKYSNKDGSRDKRRKDNVEQASYISEFNCKKCNATTDFFHKPSNSPSKRKKIIKRQLVDSGSGKRKGSDYGV